LIKSAADGITLGGGNFDCAAVRISALHQLNRQYQNLQLLFLLVPPLLLLASVLLPVLIALAVSGT